jgi:protein-tyrosine phosphatase
LEKNKIGAVCSGVDLSFKYPENIHHIKFDLDDYQGQKVDHVFEPAYNFIEEERKNTNVLVHCAAGISRCSVILISYMMKKYHWDYESCLSKVKNARPICQPNSGFVKQLKEYQKILGIPIREGG